MSLEEASLPKLYIANHVVNDYRKKKILSKINFLISVHFVHRKKNFLNIRIILYLFVLALNLADFKA